jgi:uncharacterized membrane protein
MTWHTAWLVTLALLRIVLGFFKWCLIVVIAMFGGGMSSLTHVRTNPRRVSD